MRILSFHKYGSYFEFGGFSTKKKDENLVALFLSLFYDCEEKKLFLITNENYF